MCRTMMMLYCTRGQPPCGGRAASTPRNLQFSRRPAPRDPRLDRHGERSRPASSLPGSMTSVAGAAEGEGGPRVGDQVSQVATLLSAPKHVEALTAINVELLKTALVGSAAEIAKERLHSSSSAPAQSPDGMLEEVHTAVLAVQRDCVHLMGEKEKEAWGQASWEVYHAVRTHLQRMLFGLHTLAADMGSSTAAMQAAECLASGSLVPSDQAAAFKWYTRASELGSASGSLQVGLHYFHGNPPAGHDPVKAYDCFSKALSQVDSAIQSHRQHMAHRDAEFGTLSLEEKDAAVINDRLHLEVLQEQRGSALTWLGRCYMEGYGVPRNVGQAAELFRQAGNKDELRELAMLKQQFSFLDVSDVEPRRVEG